MSCRQPPTQIVGRREQELPAAANRSCWQLPTGVSCLQLLTGVAGSCQQELLAAANRNCRQQPTGVAGSCQQELPGDANRSCRQMLTGVAGSRCREASIILTRYRTALQLGTMRISHCTGFLQTMSSSHTTG